MVLYNFWIEDGKDLAREIADVSKVANANNSLIVKVDADFDNLTVSVNSIDYNTATNEFEDNLENQYLTIRGLIAYSSFLPMSVSDDLLEFLKGKIPEVKRDMEIFDEACLNSTVESDMEELNRKYGIEKHTLNLLYKLSKEK